MSDYVNRVFVKSCEDMAEIPDGVVQVCVTSPPYYGLRDYGVDGQIGLEDSVAEFISRLVGVFREVRRVLRDDAIAFVNMGDSYAGSWGAQGRTNGAGSGVSSPYNHSLLSENQIAAAPRRTTNTGAIRGEGLKPKDLMMMPARLALALQADGWWLRDDIIWHKPNPMPSSTDDRCTPAHEHVFMLAKSARYFSDMDAVRTPIGVSMGKPRAVPAGWNTGPGRHDTIDGRYKADGEPVRSERHKTSPNRIWDDADALDRIAAAGANLRNVWTIPTESFSTTRYVCASDHDFITLRPMRKEPEAAYRCRTCGEPVERDSHFATFPIELASRCIRIGSREGDLVLDPFMGSGTTAEAAEALGRRWTGYELSQEYAALIAERTKQIGLFGAAE